jgi:hypothetical protein
MEWWVLLLKKWKVYQSGSRFYFAKNIWETIIGWVLVSMKEECPKAVWNSSLFQLPTPRQYIKTGWIGGTSCLPWSQALGGLPKL